MREGGKEEKEEGNMEREGARGDKGEEGRKERSKKDTQRISI